MTARPGGYRAGMFGRGDVNAVLETRVRASGAAARELRVALDEIAVAAVAAIDGADYAGITLVQADFGLRCLAATDVHPLMLANIARRRRQGPYFRLMADRRPVCVVDLTEDIRWPGFAADAAATTPVRSLLAQNVFDASGWCTVFTLYGDRPAAFDADTAVRVARFGAELAQVLAAAPSGRDG
ncbi:hypothetical protein ACN27E_15965 [Mycobacterium sp. WMMD1722]|uniref:hypothetical protein n=1 Tax=Mycobacterium sp. WMMD1722 TaxID=3404117 RepID=UPI003BF4FB28